MPPSRRSVGRHAHIAASEQFDARRHKIVRVAVDRGVIPNKAVGIGRRELAVERRQPWHNGNWLAYRRDCTCVERHRPHLTEGDDLDAGEMVRAVRENPSVLERKPERVLPCAAHVPVRGPALGEAALD